MTDPIADMLTRIRNALMAVKSTVEIPSSYLKIEIARVLKEEGFIVSYRQTMKGSFKYFEIKLKYADDKKPVISGLKRISKPGLRLYVGKKEVPRVMGGLGIVILSTSKGIMSGVNARKTGAGGELLAMVW